MIHRFNMRGFFEFHHRENSIAVPVRQPAVLFIIDIEWHEPFKLDGIIFRQIPHHTGDPVILFVIETEPVLPIVVYRRQKTSAPLFR